MERVESATIHKQNLCFFAIEIFKIMKGPTLTLAKIMFFLTKEKNTNSEIALILQSHLLIMFVVDQKF